MKASSNYLGIALALSLGCNAARSEILCGPHESEQLEAWARRVANGRLQEGILHPFRSGAYAKLALGMPSADGRVLRGYKMPARGVAQSKKALIILQGNLVWARQIVGDLGPFSDAGFDTYVFDYPGFGESIASKPSAGVILRDYRAVIAHIAETHPEVDLFGYSFGAVIALQLEREPSVRSIVAEGAPSRLDFLNLSCPLEVQPAVAIATARRRTLLLYGGGDPSYRVGLYKENIAVAKTHPDVIAIDIHPNWPHPQLAAPEYAAERNAIAIRFLLHE